MYRKLDRNKLKNREHVVLSSEEALKDVEPIRWNNDVLSGKQIAVFGACNK